MTLSAINNISYPLPSMQDFTENELWQRLSLDGTWQFKLGDADWTEIQVPGAWELQVGDLLTEGPALYRRSFWLDVLPAGRVMLECDGISFAATAHLNDEPIGQHTGMWSPFQWDVTSAVQVGENILEIEVWKPGDARYPLRETLAGFLPDVANTFGGIWQGLRVLLAEPAQFGIAALRVFPSADRHVFVEGVLRDHDLSEAEPDRVTGEVSLVDLATQQVLYAEPVQLARRSRRFSAGFQVPQAQPWSPQTPACYSLILQFKDEAGRILSQAQRIIGFRDVRVRDGATLLNEVPLHVRGALSWGWDAQRLCPTWSREEVRVAFEQCRALGFNLFKLCLYVPDEVLFEVADEMGMLLWLELPMWLPRVTPALKELALHEYEAILRRVHHHPSIVIVSLGCELDAEADAAFLLELRDTVHAWLPNALHCDNSGSAEAYGGVITDASDFYDYHFYADLQFFEPLVRHFDRPYKPNKPWIYGEFCDADTLRDFSLLDEANPWWLTQPTTFQRDELIWLRQYRQRLEQAGITDGGRHLTQLARRQATAVRKFIFEHTRRRSATGGYVITGWQDTPIATSGIVDDLGALKFDPRDFNQFNADRVLVLDRERRRKWQRGGDRPATVDPYVFAQGEAAELHLSLSNGAGAIDNAALDWRIETRDADHTPLLSGTRTGLCVDESGVQELSTVPWVPPLADAPVSHMLQATLIFGDEQVHNTWPVWSVPAVALDWSRVVHRLDAAAVARAQQGERLAVWLQHDDVRLTQPMPFWREAIHVPDQALAQLVRMPDWQQGDLRQFGVATDFALRPDAVTAVLKELGAPEATVRPLWRRFDARAMTWAAYVIEVKIGAGTLHITTLRFGGGMGAQPATLESNPMGAWLLHRLLG